MALTEDSTTVPVPFLYAHNYTYVMPIVKWGETIQDKLSRGRSREIEHDLAGEVEFPVFIDCVYQQGRYDEHGVASRLRR